MLPNKEEAPVLLPGIRSSVAVSPQGETWTDGSRIEEERAQPILSLSSSVSLDPSSWPGPSYGTVVSLCLEHNDIERNSCYELKLMVLTLNHEMYGKILILLNIPHTF